MTGSLEWRSSASRRLQTSVGWLGRKVSRRARFTGAYVTCDTALAAVPASILAGCDHDAVAELTFDTMTRRVLWDYPLIHWLSRVAGTGSRILDAGGHMGLKYDAFSGVLPVETYSWTVYDLPSIAKEARRRQAAGELHHAISFVSDLSKTGPVDVLVASGLLQYLDIPFEDLLARLVSRPRHILLNKVAMWEGPVTYTLERIGPAQVPYHIRARRAFEAEIGRMGYVVRDRWQIPSLGHRIETHPRLGHSESWGFCLECAR